MAELRTMKQIQTLSKAAVHREIQLGPLVKRSLLFLLVLVLSQCTTIDPARKAAVRKIVVATNVGGEVTRHQVGFTAFGNKTLQPIVNPKIKAGVRQILREELNGKFPEVLLVDEQPPMASENIFKSVDYKAWGIELARKHNADAVFIVAGRYYHPYESPSYMQAQGLGIWHLSSNAKFECFTWNWLMDAQGKSLGNFSRYFRGQLVTSIGTKERFEDYHPVDQDRIVRYCLDEFRAEISSFVKGVGL